MPTSSPRERRLEVLRDLLESEEIASQGELCQQLEGAGFAVTQSSISRDLRDLGVVKVDGCYRLPVDEGPRADLPLVEELAGDLLTQVLPAGPHMLVLKTVPGGASRLALGLDLAGWAGVVGTVAGDDTVFVATSGLRQRRRIEGQLRRKDGALKRRLKRGKK